MSTDITTTQPTTPSDDSGQVMLTKDQILALPSDIVEEIVDVPEWGGSIRIRSLTAAELAKVRQASIRFKTNGGGDFIFAEQEKRQFEYGVVEPKFTKEEVNVLFHRSAAAWRRVMDALDRISGTSDQDRREAEAAFPAGGRDGSD